MTYAGERVILDADSHVMELADFLDGHIDLVRASVAPPRRGGPQGVLDAAAAEAKAQKSDPTAWLRNGS